MPRLFLGGYKIKTVTKTKVLGYWLTQDMKTRTNTDAILEKARTQMWRIWRLLKLKANPAQMLTVLQRYIMPHLELSAPMWHFLITQEESKDLEDVLRMALKAIFGDQYGSYTQALRKAGMTTLRLRREKLTKKFAIESYSHDKFKEWYKRIDENTVRKATRLAKNPDLVTPATPNHKMLENSAIPQFIKIINANKEYIREKLARRFTCLECPEQTHRSETGAVLWTSNNKFKTKKEFIKHLELKHKLTKLSCMECGETLDSKPALEEHNRVIHGKRKHCQICDIKTETEELLTNHLRTHPMCVTCTECQITLATRSVLRQHMYAHH
jgi:hypothetical protein